MSLSEYKSPVVKKPKFGWQRYQFGNKSAAELKTSLWDANLSEVKLQNGCNLVSAFPISSFEINLFHNSQNGCNYGHKAKMTLQTPIETVNELVQFLNKRFPYLGEFRPSDDQLNVQIVVDTTWARTAYDVEGGIWNFTVCPA